MKLNQNKSLTPQQISEAEIEHPFYAEPPKPPTEEAVRRAQFVDKTYKWNGR
jgi:hypothetical protein